MLLARSAVSANTRLAARRQSTTARPRARVVTRAIDDTNFIVNLLASSAAIAAATAVTTITAEDTDNEIARLQTLDGYAPLAAAVLADTLFHSIPGINILFSLLTEPLGAAAGVAYMMSVIISSPAVDPNTLAPKGTLLNAEKAQDARAAVRVPFTQIVPTALKVVDFSNTGSSGAGWTKGEDGLPKLPINSVLIVLGVGSLILEAAAHGPLLSLFLPRVLQVTAWVAGAGYAYNLYQESQTKSSA
jgi:hypothetical protein